MILGNVPLALRSLGSARLRTALTLLGVLIGTASVILLVGVIAGGRNLVQGRLDALGASAVFVLLDDNSSDEAGTQARFNRLRPGDVAALRDRVPDVVAIAPGARTRVTITWQGVTYSPADFGATPPAFASIRNIRMSDGVFYSDADEAGHAKVTVLGQEVVDHLFADGVSPVGQKVNINGVQFRVSGVMDRKGTIGGYNQDDILFVPLSTGIDQLLGPVDTYHVIAIQAASPQTASAVAASADAVLRQEHGLTAEDSPGYQILTAADVAAGVDTVSGRFNQLLLAVAMISLVIGGVGVMNIMLVSVTERTHEIGIRKAVGAQRGDIRRQFLTEAVIVTLLGGVLGVATGLAATRHPFGEIRPEADVVAVVVALAVAVAVGVVSGFYPAERAARMTPIDALRFE